MELERMETGKFFTSQELMQKHIIEQLENETDFIFLNSTIIFQRKIHHKELKI